MIFKYKILFLTLSIFSSIYLLRMLKKLKFIPNKNLIEEIEYLTLYNKLLTEEQLVYTNKIIDLKENNFFLIRFSSGYSTLDILLINKYLECQNKNIKTYFNINNIKNKKVKIIDLCTIIANILDNAIYCSENNKLIINISNLSEPLDKFIKENIFKKGITTKIGGDNGFGLFLIKNIIENYGGNIILEEIKGNRKTS